MGGSAYSSHDYTVRSSMRASTAKAKGITVDRATFAHDDDIKSGRAAKKVHDSLSPKGVKIRESRDSAAHPVTVPIVLLLDTTGSMADVPKIIQKNLSRLMGCFLDDKTSGKKYLGEGYPAIMIGAVDDYDAQASYKHEGALQVGQFESGIEIDDNLTNIWLTENGGGTYHESYELGMYFVARHTAHDNWDKRKRKGYMFIMGDEHAYPAVSKEAVKTLIGDSIQSDISLADILEEVKERYHVFFILPNMTNHYSDKSLEQYWVKLLSQQNVIKLKEPDKICECIVGAVAICEENVGLDELVADGVASPGDMALTRLAQAAGEVSKYSAADLPAVSGSSGGSERL